MVAKILRYGPNQTAAVEHANGNSMGNNALEHISFNMKTRIKS